MHQYDVVVVGGGHASVALAGQLAKVGFSGSLAVLEAQEHLPYERPPLSKSFMLDEVAEEDLLLRKPEYWTSGAVDLHRGAVVTQLDPAARTVRTSAGDVYRYGSLVWAAGAAARRLPIPGGEADNVLTVRTLDDARRLRSLAGSATSVVIVGGGYIGLETAATLTKLGKRVTVVEAQPRLLARVSGAAVAEHLYLLHTARGVDVRLGTGVESFRVVDGAVTAVRFDDGSEVDADLVVTGIGVTPRVQPLVDAGARVGDGVGVDEACRTSLADVYAIGDVAARPSEFAEGRVMRLESVPSTTEQAKIVAAELVGAARPPHGVPWFWSNQYEVRLQTAGILADVDREVVRPAGDGSGMVVGYFRRNRLVAVDCLNSPKDFLAAKQIIGRNVLVTPEQFGDASVALRELVANRPSSTAVSIPA